MTQRPLYFLFPQMNINSGGHIAQLNFLAIAQSITNAQPVTYKKREANTLFLDDLIKDNRPGNNIYVIHWGPDIGKLLKKLKHKHVIYISHSTPGT